MSVQEGVRRGLYFEKQEYRDKPLPEWLVARLRLPAPQLPEAPEVIPAYWQAWEMAFDHFRRPRLGSRLVSNFLDPMADGRLRMWDACTMASFCDLAHDLLPGIRALDNFYVCQHENGEICREIDFLGSDVEAWVNREGRPLFSRQTGREAELGGGQWRGGAAAEQGGEAGGGGGTGAEALAGQGGEPGGAVPDLTLDGLCHPLLAWAELESYRQSGDAGRVAAVWPALVRFYEVLVAQRRHDNGLFVADWSWMDNSPRNVKLGCGVDASCEMVLFARCLAEMAPVAARQAEAEGRFPEGLAARRRGDALVVEAEACTAVIRERLWDPQRGFFYDLLVDGRRSEVATAAGFWALAAGVATAEQAQALCGWLRDPATFGRACGVPSLSAAAAGYDARGGYFRGAVWPPLMLMVARGLARYGHDGLAREVAMRHVRAAAAVVAETGTFWESYAPDAAAPGKPARPDCIGWGGVGPITLLLEFGIGLRANAPLDELQWTVNTLGACGCDRYWFRGTRVKVAAEARGAFDEPLRIRIEAERPIRLVVRTGGRRAEWRVTGRQAYVM